MIEVEKEELDEASLVLLFSIFRNAGNKKNNKMARMASTIPKVVIEKKIKLYGL